MFELENLKQEARHVRQEKNSAFEEFHKLKSNINMTNGLNIIVPQPTRHSLPSYLRAEERQESKKERSHLARRAQDNLIVESTRVSIDRLNGKGSFDIGKKIYDSTQILK